MEIRRFKPEDAEEISYLISTTLREINVKDYPLRIIENVERKHLPSKLIEKSKYRDVFVAEESGEILGTISVEGDVVFSVFIKSNYQRKGIGRKMIEYIENNTKDKGIKTLRVSSSTTSFEFYKKLGYRKIKSCTHKLYGETILMSKTI
ncbi:GNAT family N-acetyltransferase [Candidatus Bathyarchaeota archaeon]|nr:GNAT family N-acetyltransferase [Candidatus Bathyarchaeota archaeon]